MVILERQQLFAETTLMVITRYCPGKRSGKSKVF
jgi:hypothetical protein